MDYPLSFPTELSLTDEQLRERFVRWEHTLPVDPSLHFSVAITRDWRVMATPADAPTPEAPLSTVALLRRVARPEAEIEVVAAHLPREIDPADWLLVHLRNHQYKVARMRRLPSPTGEAGDTLSLVRVKSAGYAARSLAVKDGARVFVVHCQTAQHDYEALAEEFLTALVTFRLLNPTGERFAEPVKTHRVEAPVACEFAFPASWAEQPDSAPPPGGHSFSLVNLRRGEWAGQFTFAAVRREHEAAHAGLVSNYLGQLRENGVAVQAEELRPQEPPPQFKAMWAGAFPAEREGDPSEVRCVVVEHAKAWLLFAVVGPGRDYDPEAQAVNARAFRLAVETLSAGASASP